MLPEVFLPFWYGLKEARSVQERPRVILSQYGPELVRVQLIRSLLYEPWRIVMNETVHRKALKTQQFSFTPKNLYRTRKSINFQRNCLFSLSSNHSNYLNQMYFHIFYSSCFTSRGLTSFIIPVGITVKSGPEYWRITARYIFTSSGHIIKGCIDQRLQVKLVHALAQ